MACLCWESLSQVSAVLTWRKLTRVSSTFTWWPRVVNTAMPAKKGNCNRWFFRSKDHACAPGASLRGESTCPCC